VADQVPGPDPGEGRQPSPAVSVNDPGAPGIVATMDNDIVKRLTWSVMLTASGALATMIAARLTAVAYRRIFNEDPPE
jgi:hypothetical protein